jgi:hypothetical protein
MAGDMAAVAGAQGINDGISTFGEFVPKRIRCH